MPPGDKQNYEGRNSYDRKLLERIDEAKKSTLSTEQIIRNSQYPSER
jgi:hypothetical protein